MDFSDYKGAGVKVKNSLGPHGNSNWPGTNIEPTKISVFFEVFSFEGEQYVSRHEREISMYQHMREKISFANFLASHRLGQSAPFTWISGSHLLYHPAPIIIPPDEPYGKTWQNAH